MDISKHYRETQRFTKNRVRHLMFLGVSVVSIAFSIYVGWHIFTIISPPSLTIVQPHDTVVHGDRRIVIEGVVTPESEVTINNTPLIVDDGGRFVQVVYLEPGVNEFVVRAWQRYSRTRTVVQRVYFQPDGVVKRTQIPITN